MRIETNREQLWEFTAVTMDAIMMIERNLVHLRAIDGEGSTVLRHASTHLHMSLYRAITLGRVAG